MKTYKLEFTIDPPMNCSEFGEWSGDPNIALKDAIRAFGDSYSTSGRPSMWQYTALLYKAFNNKSSGEMVATIR